MSNTNTKRQAVIETEVVRDANGVPAALRLTCVNGEHITITQADLARAVIDEAIFHGLKQKLVDAAAISRNPDNGRSATPDDKWRAVTEVYSRLLGGMWNAPREGTGGGQSLLVQALVRYYGGKHDADRIREFLAEKTDEQKAALRKNPVIAKIIAELQAEKVKATGVDTDALLGELDG